MESIRIMPCLDMKDGRVVKGVHFVNLQEAGDPVQNAAFYQEEGADELAMLDIAATLENRKTRLSWVQAVSAVIDIPLTVGGGIGTLEDIEMVLDAGADKVSMNSAAVKDPDLVKKASEKFGKEKITIAIDGCRNSSMPSGFEVVVSGGTKPVGKDAPFTRAISDAVSLPVVASGGAGKLEDFYQAVTEGGASVLLAASVFHFRLLGIGQVKDYLRSKGLPVAGE
jgi:cyclase